MPANSAKANSQRQRKGGELSKTAVLFGEGRGGGGPCPCRSRRANGAPATILFNFTGGGKPRPYPMTHRLHLKFEQLDRATAHLLAAVEAAGRLTQPRK